MKISKLISLAIVFLFATVVSFAEDKDSSAFDFNPTKFNIRK